MTDRNHRRDRAETGKTKGKVLSIVMIQAIDGLISLKMDVLRLASPVAYPLNSSTFPSE